MIYLLCIVVLASRFLPHPPNVACLGALGLFAGCYLPGRRAFLLPMAVLFASDVMGHVLGIPGMGFYNPITMVAVYAGVSLAVPVGRWLANHRGTWFSKSLRLAGGSVAASTLFFLTSNFGVFLGGWYSISLTGLISCYAAAIPFYGYTLAGDLVYSALMFGGLKASAGLPSLAIARGDRLRVS